MEKGRARRKMKRKEYGKIKGIKKERKKRERQLKSIEW